MRNGYRALVCALLLAGGASAGSLPSVLRSPAAERCAGEILNLHGVWRAPEVFTPAYADWPLVAYLASLKTVEPNLAVVPVYSSEPFYFRSNHVVFVSTSFILQAGSEAELTEAIRTARVSVRSADLPHCGAMEAQAATGLVAAQRRLAAQVAEYEALSARRLKKRDGDGR